MPTATIERWQTFLPDDNPKLDHRSDLIKATSAAGGRALCFCPFVQHLPREEQERHIDENGKCEHYIGDTLPHDPTKFHAKVRQTKKTKTGEIVETGYWVTDGSVDLDVLPNDKLERISVASRVYRSIPDQQKQAKKKGETSGTPSAT